MQQPQYLYTPKTDFVSRLLSANKSLARGAIRADRIGDIVSPKTIKRSGILFKELREYDVGDELKHVHWLSSARAGKLLVKTYEEEHSERFLFLIDTSLEMLSGFSQPLFQHAVEDLCFLAAICIRKKISFSAAGVEDTKVSSPKVLSNSRATRYLLELLRTRNFYPSTNSKSGLFSSQVEMLLRTERKLNIFYFSTYPGEGIPDLLQRSGHKIFGVWYDPVLTLPSEGLLSALDPSTGQEKLFDFSSHSTREFFELERDRRQASLNQAFARNKMTFVPAQSAPALTFRSVLK